MRQGQNWGVLQNAGGVWEGKEQRIQGAVFEQKKQIGRRMKLHLSGRGFPPKWNRGSGGRRNAAYQNKQKMIGWGAPHHQLVQVVPSHRNQRGEELAQQRQKEKQGQKKSSQNKKRSY